jgi:hypothetical protein
LTEHDVCRLVTIKDAIATLEDLFATWSDPATVNLPRQRAPVGGSAVRAEGLFCRRQWRAVSCAALLGAR